MALERQAQTRSPRAILHGCNSRFQFADANDAQKQDADVLSRDPARHPWFRALPHQLGRNTRPEERSVHE